MTSFKWVQSNKMKMEDKIAALACVDPDCSRLWADARILNAQVASQLHKYAYLF